MHPFLAMQTAPFLDPRSLAFTTPMAPKDFCGPLGSLSSLTEVEGHVGQKRQELKALHVLCHPQDT